MALALVTGIQSAGQESDPPAPPFFTVTYVVTFIGPDIPGGSMALGLQTVFDPTNPASLSQNMQNDIATAAAASNIVIANAILPPLTTTQIAVAPPPI